MKLTRSAATKSLTVLTSLFLGGSLASCDAAAQTGSKVAEAIESAPSIAVETPAVPAPAAPAEAPAAPAASGEAATSIALLETIPVKGRAPKTGYARDEFGPAWADTNKNGCDTRIICTRSSHQILGSL